MLPEIFDSSDKPFEVFVEEKFYILYLYFPFRVTNGGKMLMSLGKH